MMLRPWLVGAALCGLATSILGAQQLPADSAALPHVGGGPGFEFRVGADYLSAQRNVWLNQTIQQATGKVQGGDGFLWIPGSPFGFSGRYLQADFGLNQPQLVAADANLFIGTPDFAIEGGFARRALATTVSTAMYSFWRLGAQSLFPIGGSGLRGMLAAVYYVPQTQPKPADGSQSVSGQIKNGMDGEAAILFNPPHVSFLYLKVGYRAEAFNAKRASGEIPEEVRGLSLGGGFQFGGH